VKVVNLVPKRTLSNSLVQTFAVGCIVLPQCTVSQTDGRTDGQIENIVPIADRIIGVRARGLGAAAPPLTRAKPLFLCKS